jgi:hypothetical protein
MDYSYDIIQWICLFSQLVCLVVFIWYCLKYIKEQQEKYDPYTLGSSIFIILSLLSRILMRTPDILVIELKYHSTIGEYTMDDLGNSNSTVLCVYFASAVIPIGLFNSAILINATRWLHLIYMFKKKKDASDRSF